MCAGFVPPPAVTRFSALKDVAYTVWDSALMTNSLNYKRSLESVLNAQYIRIRNETAECLGLGHGVL